MTGYIDTIGGESFPVEDFTGKNYIPSIPRLATAIKRHVAQAWNAVSTTEHTIGSDIDKTFTFLTPYGSPPAFEGQPRLKIAVAGSAENLMWGNVKSYNPLTGETVVAIDKHAGSGTFSSWTATIAGADGAAEGASDTATYVTTGDESSGLANSKQLGGRYGTRAIVSGSNIYLEGERKPAAVTGTTYSQLAADREAVLRFTNAAGCAVTLLRPHDSSGAPNNAPTGFATWIDAVGGAVTCTPSTGTVSHDGVSGAASFVFPKGSFGLLESAGGDVWIAHVLRRGRQILTVTGDTTFDRTHNGALVLINSATTRTMTLPETDDLGVGTDFEIEFQAVLGTHVIARAGSNVFDLAGGGTSLALIEGTSAKLRSNGGADAAGIWASLRGGQAAEPLLAQCRLDYVSTSSIRLNRAGGKYITLLDAAGVPTPRAIPASGPALAPTGLTPGDRLNVFAYWTGSDVALEQVATAWVAHAGTGLEVKDGDPTRRLVGMLEVATGPAYKYTDAEKMVLSRHNRKPVACVTALTGDNTPSVTTPTELVSMPRARWLAWAGDLAQVRIAGRLYSTVATGGGKTMVYASENGGSMTAQEGVSSGTTATVNQDNVPIAAQAAVLASTDAAMAAAMFGISSSANQVVWTGHATDKDKRCSMIAQFMG